jgi:hypothetical protein
MIRHVGSGLVLAFALAGAVLVLAALEGCSAIWTRLPDPAPGVARYDVRIEWGLASGIEPPRP